MSEIIKMICLFFAILFSLVNGYRLHQKSDIPAINIILQAAGITGFIVFQWLV